MQLRHTLTLLVGTLSAFTCLAAPPDVAGTWRIEVPRAGGVTIRTYLLLHPNEGSFTGSVIINDAVEIPVRHPRFEGDEAIFETDWTIDYRLRADGDRLAVTITTGGKNPESTVAVRVPESAALAPAVAPLPEFVPVPANGLASTPPMGWSSWNRFANGIDDATVREIADALVRSGLASAGYVYVNIDDGWTGGRDATGHLRPNEKFPDMKALADYVHARGLKLGLYSSPGPRTCGGYEGSYGHEELDAQTFAAWGVDFLKYDWCSAARLYGYQPANLQAAYGKMGRALVACGRPIVYSICEYGSGEVWKWGRAAGGNLWRTTGDIQDNWPSVAAIGFAQSEHADNAGPGGWNDPDMLEVGNGGMSATEYRTHFSLWCLLAAPLVAGNDMRHMTAETLAILGNREAIAVDQDALGRPARRLSTRGTVELWARPLHDGGQAIGLFNRGETAQRGAFTWAELGLPSPPHALRDLWHHTELLVEPTGFQAEIPAHGVVFLRLK